ncbi:hypothetical protein F0L74_21950 [Chitinophaga agrisoli]|uniref:YD repeat-containing protein n=1 Tax=Chitinophaga agrisoli TaxID=2607653 RepID=A0A5B2VJW7_9BACT|nr:hypothetical protein [Chitinophaga agrisoli]KAA2238880.1 hypothetical protein F0L74_21950 [Chitinophaga agrisoli]
MHKYHFLLGVLLLTFNLSHGQVNLPTGKAEFNFPIYSYSDGNRLSTSINLNYTGGGGVKVDELASSVGLGWELQYGGVISRSTVGDPDDQVATSFGIYDAAAPGYLTHTDLTAVPKKIGWLPLTSAALHYFKHDAQTIADREQDVFNFRFEGEQGRFVIGSDGTIRSLKETNLKFEKVEEDMSAARIITRISKFIITTPSGIQFVFADKNLSKIISYESAPPQQFFTDPVIANKSYYLSRTNYNVNNYAIVTDWYLSEIVNPLTGKKITFSYEAYDLAYMASQSAVNATEDIGDGDYKETTQWFQSRFSGTVKRITAINLPNNTTVVFKYFDTERVDLPGDKALKQITIKNGTTENEGFLFTYQYFSKAALRAFNYSFPADEVGNARLCLLSLQKTGRSNAVDQPYVFSYNIGASGGLLGWVPPRNAASQDYWGYYNPAVTYPYDNNLDIYKNLQNLYASRFRVVNILTAVNGSLKSVKYPTGGTLEYEYEGNTALSNNANVAMGGIRVKKVTQFDKIDPAKNIVNEYRYVDEVGKSSGWGYEAPVNQGESRTYMVVPGSGSYYAAYPSMTLARAVTEDFMTSYLRNNRIVLKPKDAIAFNVATEVFVAAVLFIVKQFFFSGTTTKEIVTSNFYSHHPKNQNPLPFLYSRVEVYKGTAADNIGKTVYEYTSDKDFAIPVPDFKPPYSARQRYFPWAYGLLKRTVVYNQAGQPVSEAYNKYSYHVAEYKTSDCQSLKYTASRILLCPADYYLANIDKIWFDSEYYYPLIGRMELDFTIQKSYSNANDYMMDRTDYTYDPVYHDIKKKTTTNSLGETIEERTYYPYDYNITGVLTQLKDKNMIGQALAIETWLLKDGVEPRLLDAEVSDLQAIPNGDLRPVKGYKLTSATPVSESVIGSFDPTKLNRNTGLFRLQETYTYDNAGRIIQTANKGRLESNIYDDNGQLVIAKVLNAGSSVVAYSSFEDNAKGNWTITPVAGATPIIADATAPTGQKAINLSQVTSIVKTGLTAAVELTISFWSKGGTVTVTGGTKKSEQTGPTVGGWTLKRINISGATSVSVNGTGYIDELRLAPKDASMTTQTFNDWLTVSTQTGNDNITTYYEYDNLGKLKYVRDRQRNIIAAHEYKYQQ